MATITELLAQQKFEALTQEQVDSFMKYGFLKIEGAIIPEKGDEWMKYVWDRIGMDPNDKSTWHTERINMPRWSSIPVSEVAPKAWQAICEICGGEDRVSEIGKHWSDGFIVNVGTDQRQGEVVPPKDLDHWHIDGDWFIHFLDSPEQALLVIPCWTDVESNGGATWVCDQGPEQIARLLYDHPEGLTPTMGPRSEPSRSSLGQFYHDLVQDFPDSNFHEMTGKKGDVVLLHPFTLHSASKNGRRLPRVITNPPVCINAPFQYLRSNPRDYSLVELKTMHAVGGDAAPSTHFQKEWKITGKRELCSAGDREAAERKFIAAELERLKKLGLVEKVTCGKAALAAMESKSMSVTLQSAKI